MTDPFELPTKPRLYRSFEADVARVLGIQKEEAEIAVVQKKSEYEQRRTRVRKVGAKRLFYLTAGALLLTLAVLASIYLLAQYKRTIPLENIAPQESLSVEVSQEMIENITTRTRESLLQKGDGVFEIALTKNGMELSLSELYALLPTKKAAQKAEGLETFLYGARVLGEETHHFIIIKEGVSRAPKLPVEYDDTLFSLGIGLLDLSLEAKTLLAEERFTQTHIQNVPARSVAVTSETGQESIVIVRIQETGALLVTTKKALQNGLLDSLSTSTIVLSL